MIHFEYSRSNANVCPTRNMMLLSTVRRCIGAKRSRIYTCGFLNSHTISVLHACLRLNGLVRAPPSICCNDSSIHEAGLVRSKEQSHFGDLFARPDAWVNCHPKLLPPCTEMANTCHGRADIGCHSAWSDCITANALLSIHIACIFGEAHNRMFGRRIGCPCTSAV